MARCYRQPYDTNTVTIDLLLVQLLVLGATGALFWFARRELKSRPPGVPLAPPDTRELEQLCVTLESLVTEQSRRLDRLERQMAQTAHVITSDNGLVGAPLAAPYSVENKARPVEEGAARDAPTGQTVSATIVPLDTRYAPIYALLDAGVSDPQEITRRVGLSRGEVDLILSLRERRAL